MTKDDIKRMQSSGELMINDNSDNENISKQVDLLVNEYQFLKKYLDYIEFLKIYSGFTYLEDDGEISLSFYGFDNDTTLNITEGEGDIIDEKKFFVIGDYTYFNKKTDKNDFVGLGVDSSHKREPGFYSFNDTEEKIVASTFDELITIFLTDREKLLFS